MDIRYRGVMGSEKGALFIHRKRSPCLAADLLLPQSPTVTAPSEMEPYVRAASPQEKTPHQSLTRQLLPLEKPKVERLRREDKRATSGRPYNGLRCMSPLQY